LGGAEVSTIVKLILPGHVEVQAVVDDPSESLSSFFAEDEEKYRLTPARAAISTMLMYISAS
jgi:hypothetical protein